MTDDQIREAVAQTVIEWLVNADLGRACQTVRMAFEGADEVRVEARSKGGSLSVSVEALRDGVSLGGFGS